MSGSGRLGGVELLLEESGESHQLEGKMAGTMTGAPNQATCQDAGIGAT